MSFVVCRRLFVVVRSSFVVRRSFVVVCSFVVRRSSFVVRRSLFVVRRSSFAANSVVRRRGDDSTGKYSEGVTTEYHYAMTAPTKRDEYVQYPSRWKTRDFRRRR